MIEVPGWPEAFRGSAAVAAGLVTKNHLRGPRFLRLFPDTYVAATGEPPDLMLRSHAAYRYVEGRGGVLSGWSAAEVLDASCGPAGAPAEVTVPGGGQRVHPGLLVHRDRLAPGEMQAVQTEGGGTLRTTTPVRTAYDLARRCDFVDGVVAVDALSRRHGFSPDLLINFTAHFPGARGKDGVFDVLTYADRRSGSPMETRLRLLLVLAGLPSPQVQWVVQDERARRVVWLDLAYPGRMIGIEYEGAHHLTEDGVLRDTGRYTGLVDRGWRIYRYTKREIFGEPETIVAQISRALERPR